MWSRLIVLSSILCFSAATAPADEVSDRAKLAGKWQPAAGDKNGQAIWTLEETDGSIRVMQESNGQKIVDYQCKTSARECDLKEAGRAGKVSMWFNGPRLVEMRTHGKEVVKRRFQVIGDGDTLELEVIPMVPDGKPEVIHMSRLRTEGDHKTQ